MKKQALLFGIFAILAVMLTACAGSAATQEPVTLTVDMKDFSFTPADATVPAGSEITLNLTNSGTLEHEWVIMMMGKEATAPFDDNDEGNILWEHELQPGQQESVTFTAPSEPGTYEIVCGTPGHLEAGMKGTLTVTSD